MIEENARVQKISELGLLEQLDAYQIDPCELLTSALMPGNILPIPVCG